MDINFKFVVDEDQLLAALESGATMEQIREVFDAAVNKAAEKKLQKQREENEARIAKERDNGLRDALDYLLDWYDTYYGEFDYTAPHAIITPGIRERALEFARFIIEDYKDEEAKPKATNADISCACTHPEAKEVKGAECKCGKEKISNSVADAKKKPEVKAYTYKIAKPEDIDKILESFFKNYNL